MNAPVAGIDRLSVHVPRWSLSRGDLASSWSAGTPAGNRSVADHDEDSITMGVEAALGLGVSAADVLIFATTSPVFTERQHASTVAAALGLSPRVCLDVGGSLRSGLDALVLARDLVLSGAADSVLIVVADRRDLPPGSSLERMSGDAGAAALVIRDPALCAITGSATLNDPAIGMWRNAQASAVTVGDERFVGKELIEPWLIEALGGALAAADIAVADLKAAAVASPLPNVGERAARRSGLTSVATSPIPEEIGFCGAAAPLLELALAIRHCGAGDHVAVAAAGDGATAVCGTVVPGAEVAGPALAIDRAIADRRRLPVGTFHRLRSQLPEPAVSPFTSEMIMRREQESLLQLIGTRCLACDAVSYPPRRICTSCGAKDRRTDVRLPMQGELFTFTVEHLFPVPVNELVMGVVDLGIARIYTQLTDVDPDECFPGLPVRLVLRRVHSGGGFPHYFWKAKPLTRSHGRAAA